MQLIICRLCLRRRIHIMQPRLQLLRLQRASRASVVSEALGVLVNSDIGTLHNLIQQQQHKCKQEVSFRECKATPMDNLLDTNKPSI